MEMTGKFLEKMYRTDADFVFTVTRDSVRQCETPILILPDDVPAHPYVVALESAHLAPNAQVSIYPWKANPEQIQLALRHVRAFLMRALSEAGQSRRDHRMTAGSKMACDIAPAPSAKPRARAITKMDI